MARSTYLYDLVTRLWPLNKIAYQLGNRPLIGKLIRPFFSTRANQAMFLPVNETIQTPQSSPLPLTLLEPLVRQASSRFIMDYCLCRHGENCQNFPQELGCLYLGDGAAQINPSLGRVVSVEEAIEHIHKAMAVKLNPLIVHTTFDSVLLGIPFRRMLTVCFCCECCCTVRRGLRMGPPAFWDVLVKLPGLQMEVGEECIGCAACLDVCPVQAIELDGFQARIDGPCKGCARCVEACPEGAIRVRLDQEEDLTGQLMERIRQRTVI